MEIAIVGSGRMGSALAGHLVEAGHTVRLANSRGPETLEEKAQELGVETASVADAVGQAELVFLAIPYKAVEEVAGEGGDWSGKLVVDLTNYFEGRDGAELGPGDEPSSVVVARHIGGARVVKSFNALHFERVSEKSRPPGPDRLAVFYAGDDEQAKQTVRGLIEEVGFAPVDGGSLAESRRLEPEGPLFNVPMTGSEAEAGLEGAGPLLSTDPE